MNTVASASRNSTRSQSSSIGIDIVDLAGRVLLSVLFLLSGVGKIGAYAGTTGHMSSVGLPGVLLPLVIATEVLGAIAIILGWQTRVTAFLLRATLC